MHVTTRLAVFVRADISRGHRPSGSAGAFGVPSAQMAARQHHLRIGRIRSRDRPGACLESVEAGPVSFELLR